MRKHFNFLHITAMIFMIGGISIFGKCKRTNTPTPTPAGVKTFSLTLNSSDNAYALKAYTNIGLTEAVTNLSKIDSGKTIYIAIPKANVENKTASVSGADNVITANLVAVQMTGNKTVTANYALDTNNFTYTSNFETITGYKGSAKTIEIPAMIKEVTVKTIAGPANSTKSGFPMTIESVIVPNGVTTIGLNAFDSCLALKNITLPDGITSIGDEAFSNCIALPNITLPNSVTNMGPNAFAGCESFTNFVIPNGITTVEAGLLGSCKALTHITIPNSVTLIKEGVFLDCSALNNVIIPSGVTTIGFYAFSNCNALTTVYIEAVTPPALSGNIKTFAIGNGGVKPGLTVIVPKGSKAAYDAEWTINKIGRPTVTITEKQ